MNHCIREGIGIRDSFTSEKALQFNGRNFKTLAKTTCSPYPKVRCTVFHGKYIKQIRHSDCLEERYHGYQTMKEMKEMKEQALRNNKEVLGRWR